MSITPILSVSALLRDHPWAGEVLAWHGVRAHQVDGRMTIAALCWLHRLDEARLLRDLDAAGRALEPWGEDDAWHGADFAS